MLQLGRYRIKDGLIARFTKIYRPRGAIVIDADKLIVARIYRYSTPTATAKY